MSGSASSAPAFGSFGQLTFAVVGSPTMLTFTQQYHYAKIAIIGAPPVLQWIYDDLVSIRMLIFLHQLWCDPATIINAFKQYAQQHTPQPLIIGSDNKGNYVIDNIEERNVWRADDGTLIAGGLGLQLLQYVTPPLQPSISQPPGGATAVSPTAPGHAATAQVPGAPYEPGGSNIPPASGSAAAAGHPTEAIPEPASQEAGPTASQSGWLNKLFGPFQAFVPP